MNASLTPSTPPQGRGGEGMTPLRSIRVECRSCKGGQVFRCESKTCFLNRAWRPLPKIKAHCRECNGDDHPKDCTGRLLDGNTCILHEFRLGKNPHAKKRILSPERRLKAIEVLAKHRRESCSSASFSPPGSTITLSGVPEGGR